MTWKFKFQEPKICLSIPARKIRDIERTIKRYDRWVDTFEIRLDWLTSWTIDQMGAFKDRPIVWTCRPERHGGRFKGNENERIRLLLELARRGWGRWVDLEHDVPSKVLETFRPYTQLLLSYHRHSPGRPKDWSDITKLLAGKPHDAIKIALNLETFQDVAWYLDRMNEFQARIDPIVWVIMNERHSWFRILSPWFGSLWTYAAPSKSFMSTGPGQVPVDQLIHVYRYRDMKPDHLLFGIIGHPIGHSLSPYLHNMALREMHVTGHYVAFDVDNLESFWHLLDFLPIRGLSVTAPHKETVRKFIDRLDDHAKRIGAVNTIVRWDRRTGGFNTDWTGFWRPLERLAGRQSWRPLIIGAGGAARAVGYAFWTHKIPFLITNRNMDRAEPIARRFDGRTIPWHRIQPSMFDLIVHATPVGMAPNHKTSLKIPESWFQGTCVYDLVYNPMMTRLLIKAKVSGASLTIPGFEMLVEQAWEQLKLWLNMAPSQEFLTAASRAYLEQIDDTASLF